MIMASDGGGINNRGLEKLIREMGTDVEGSPGFWEFTAYGQRLYCITDESQDRMRVMTSIADASKLTPDILTVCMEANFDRALDARYCLHDNVLWAAFMHPLRSLRPNHFRSACSQVAKLSENFGTSYSSGQLRFGS